MLEINELTKTFIGMRLSYCIIDVVIARTVCRDRARSSRLAHRGLPYGAVSLPASSSGERLLAWYGLRMPGFVDSFERNSKVAGGALVLRGTRVPVRSVIASFAEGAGEADILRAFPTLTSEHLQAVVTFAASLALKHMRAANAEETDDGDERP
jgi:uncharacterized protein (DUF433 family)